MFDAFIVMTKTLLDYYKNLSRSTAKFIHIPMTVELERFNIEKIENSEEYIAYCGGDNNGTKDGVDILVQAFSLVQHSLPGLSLYIIGSVGDKIHNIVKELGMEDFVKFISFIHRDEMPHYLVNAKALCLARRSNLQAEGGFPTKLGEYLATGNPVIVTRVGEIPNYCEDGKNIFFAMPNDPTDFADKIFKCMTQYDIAQKIGIKGKELANTAFNYKNHSKSLDLFLQNLLDTRY